MLQRWLEKSFVDVFQRDAQTALLFFLFSWGACLLTVLLVTLVVVVVRKNRKNRETPRQIQFTLPDRENTYIRARLATVLNPEAEVEQEDACVEVNFSHARLLLHKVWFAPLSPAERLEMDGLEKTLEKYTNVTRFKEKDVRAINDAFARLLKLSAKYGV